MEEALLKFIQTTQDRKVESGIVPIYTLRLEIEKAVSAALNELYKKGVITVGDTLNDKWIAII